MRDVVRDWRDASGEGVTQFVGKVLSDRIDAIESGSWANYWTAMLGSTIWAASCFINPELAVAVFAMNMAGIAIGSIPGIPSAKKSSLPDIQKGLLDYLDAAYKSLNDQLPASAASAASKNPSMGRFEAVAHFIEANFKPEMRTEYKPYTSLPQISRPAVRDEMYQKALYEFNAAEAVGPAMASITDNFSRVGAPMPGDTRPKIDYGFVLMKDDVDAVTTRYAERAGLDLKFPAAGKFDGKFSDFPGPGANRRDVPPTSYFYHWLSRKLLTGAKPAADNIRQSVERVQTSMLWTLADQQNKRREFVAWAANAAGTTDPDERILTELNSVGEGRYGVHSPFRPDTYLRVVAPIHEAIVQQINALIAQAQTVDRPLDERRKYVKDIVKLP